MLFKNCIIKVVAPWVDKEGYWQRSILRFDARGTEIDRRRIRREVTRWYKESLGRSISASLVKAITGKDVICVDATTTGVSKYTQAEKDAVTHWLIQLQNEEEHETKKESDSPSEAGASNKAEVPLRPLQD